MKKKLLLIMLMFLGFGINVVAANLECTYRMSGVSHLEGQEFRIIKGQDEGVSISSSFSGASFSIAREVSAAMNGGNCLQTLYLNCGYNASGQSCSLIPTYRTTSTSFTATLTLTSSTGGNNGNLSGGGTNNDANNINTSDCPAIFGSSDDPGTLAYFIETYAFKPIRYLVPIILILMTSLDFAKAVFMKDQEGMKKAQDNFVKRAVAALIIFLAPTIVSIVFTLIDNVIQGSCLSAGTYAMMK